MLRTILVAIDFSEQSESALDQAIAIAELMHSELVLLWVEAQRARAASDAAIYGSSVQEIERLVSDLNAESRARLEGLADRARSRGVAVAIRVEAGHADEVIVELADRIDADLIVTGTKGLTGVKRFFLGSVAEKVARMSATNVLVARGAARPLRRILCPTDFSAASEPAVELAAALAARAGRAGDDGRGVAIHLLHAWQYPAGTHGVSTPNPTEGPLAALRDEIVHAGEVQGGRLIERYRGEGYVMRFLQEHGAPAAVIQEHLEEQLDIEPYDLVVMGTHGYRGFRRLLLGSVAEATVRHSPCSVAVVHARAPDRA